MNRDEIGRAKRLRLFLRDHRILDATLRVPDGQRLSMYLASRPRFLDLTDIDWMGLSEQDRQLALKVDQILWAGSEDGDLKAEQPEGECRRVEIELESGYLMRADLILDDHQPLTEYLHAAPAFVPLREAHLMPRGKSLGDVAVNQAAIQVVRELPPPPEPGSEH